MLGSEKLFSTGIHLEFWPAAFVYNPGVQAWPIFHEILTKYGDWLAGHPGSFALVFLLGLLVGWLLARTLYGERMKSLLQQVQTAKERMELWKERYEKKVDTMVNDPPEPEPRKRPPRR